jgi:hypothetical protein
MIDNQTLFDQMLPPIYQQNNASIMRTNYPGYFTSEESPRRYGTGSDAQSDAGPIVRLFRIKPLISTCCLLFKIHSFDRVWADYKKRTNLERAVPRPFSLVNNQLNSSLLNLFSINRNESLH